MKKIRARRSIKKVTLEAVDQFEVPMWGKSILVTGGSGFLGSHVCDRLVARGADVICADNLFTGRKKNISHLLGEENFEFLRHDVTVPLFVEVDQIYNLACPASPLHYQRDPVQTTKTSVLGAMNVLGLAKRLDARVFQASTSEIYGDPMLHPQREDYWGNVNPIGPRSCYDEGKRCAETLFFDYHRQHNLDIRVARIFNTYGPRMRPDDGRVISRFIVQALKGEDLTIFGDGSQTRSFCYVDDLIDAIILYMDHVGPLPGPINLGNESECSILEIAQQIVELVGSKSTLDFRPLPGDDPQQRRPNISYATEVLEWRPKIELRDGLSKTITYFDALLRTEHSAKSTANVSQSAMAKFVSAE